MTDPYKVLGVSTSATDEEIKSAYKSLVKKYHPDNYAQSPLADLAEEKMKEINEAYDTIMKQRESGTSGSYNSYSGHGSQGSYNSYGNSGNYNSSSYYKKESQFSDIRNMFNSGRYTEAEQLLDGTPEANRNAEWYYLKGVIYYQRGWLDEAAKYLKKAIEMDPKDMEYQVVYNRLMAQRQHGSYGFPGSNTQNTDCSGCNDSCTTLLCANCLLNMCCGGGHYGCC